MSDSGMDLVVSGVVTVGFRVELSLGTGVMPRPAVTATVDVGGTVVVVESVWLQATSSAKLNIIGRKSHRNVITRRIVTNRL